MSALKQGLDSFIDWGIAKASEVSSSILDVLIDVVGSTLDESTDDTAEVISGQVLSVDAAVICRPADPDSNGAMEVAFVRRGDEATILATREPRWQINLEKGEVAVRSFGASAANIILKPNGDVVVNSGTEILLGNDTAGEAIALAANINAALDAIANATPAANDGGAAIQTALKSQWNGTSTTCSSQRVKADS